jgi:hypothetical protein
VADRQQFASSNTNLGRQEKSFPKTNGALKGAPFVLAKPLFSG